MEKGKEKVRSSSSLSNWACLCDDLLDSIFEKLVVFSDHIRFSAVCKSWNSMALTHKEKRSGQKNHQLPFLLVVSKHEDNRKHNLYNFISAEICYTKLRIPYKYKRSRFCGSSHGWLFHMRPIKLQLIVYNPLYGTVISLPAFNKKFKPYSVKATLSRDPYLGSFEVFAFCSLSHNVAHLKFGDEFWTFSSDCYFNGITFYKDRMLGVSHDGHNWSINVITVKHNSSPYLHTTKIPVEFFVPPHYDHFFVETTKGDLLIVLRSDDNYMHHRHTTYKIFQIIESNGKLEPIPVEDLSGDSLFLENNNSTSVLASDYPGCRPNSIYGIFHRRYQLWYGVEEFNLEDHSVKKVQRFPTKDYFQVSWIKPSTKLRKTFI